MADPGFSSDQNQIGELSDLYVEFDGQQVEIRTNIPEIAENVAAMFAHMLVSGVWESAGKVEILRTEIGYEMRSAETTRYEPTDLQFLLDVVRDEIRIQFMRARPDLLWLHAAAVERDGSALLISGASGQGKSTFATLLCDRGWRFMSDDVAPTLMDADVVLPFSQTPRRRIYPGSAVQPFMVGSLDRESLSVDSVNLRREPAPVRAIVYVNFDDGASTRIDRLDAGSSALELLRNAVNFGDHKEAAVARAAGAARRLAAFRLTYSSAEKAAGVLDKFAF